MSPSAGTSFGRYRLLGVLGRGGMAVCHRARMEGPHGFERECVVKRILPEHARNAQFVAMLAHEAKVSALLCHPNIVRTYELGEVGGELYLAMELIDGVDLRTLLADGRAGAGPLPVGAACHLTGGIAAALAYAHDLTDDAGRALEIVHRDVSPSNILVTEDGVAKLLDFGIAKAGDALPRERTETGVVKGKPGYMAPEQAMGGVVDRRSDLFALGIVLYESVTLRPLFKGHNDLHSLHLLREGRVERPSRVVPVVPRALDELVLAMLAPDPAARPQTAGEVAAALAAIAAEASPGAPALRARVAAAGPRSDLAPSTDPSAAERTRPHRSRPQPRRRARVVLAVGAAAALATLLGVAHLARHREEVPSAAARAPAPPSAPPSAPATGVAATTPAPAPGAPAAVGPRAHPTRSATAPARRSGGRPASAAHGDVLKDPFARRPPS